jgi:hypothetical protein
MNEEKILQHLLRELTERERTLSDNLGTGTAKDYAEYKELCGHIQGLVYAQFLIKDLVRKMENFEDE